MLNRRGLQMTMLKKSQQSAIEYIWVEGNGVKGEAGNRGAATTMSTKLTNKLKELETNLIEQGKKRIELQYQVDDVLEQLQSRDKQK